MTPRLMSDQKPSIVWAWTAPTTYSLRACRTNPCGKSFQPLVAGVLIGREQINLGGHGLAHETLERRGIRAVDDAGDHAALAADGARDDQLTRGATPTRPLAAVLVLGLAADVGLVRFHDAHELAKLGVGKAGADAVAHIVGSAVGAEAHYALHFERGHALLGGHHHVDDPEPVPQAHIRVLENGPDQYREAIAVRRTCLALPMERTSLQLGHLVVAAARAADTFGPAPPQ